MLADNAREGLHFTGGNYASLAMRIGRRVKSLLSHVATCAFDSARATFIARVIHYRRISAFFLRLARIADEDVALPFLANYTIVMQTELLPLACHRKMIRSRTLNEERGNDRDSMYTSRKRSQGFSFTDTSPIDVP